MQCPLCTIELNVASRQGLEIDYCPKCRGIWLDRGELDKIIESAFANQPDKSITGSSDGRAESSDCGGIHGYPHGRRYANTRNKFLIHNLFDD